MGGGDVDGLNNATELTAFGTNGGKLKDKSQKKGGARKSWNLGGKGKTLKNKGQTKKQTNEEW